jgi:hypothetical protein
MVANIVFGYQTVHILRAQLRSIAIDRRACRLAKER